MRSSLSRLLNHRLGGLVLFAGWYLVQSAVLRAALFTQSLHQVDAGPLQLLGIGLAGFANDLLTLLVMSAPIALFLAVLPERLFGSRVFRWLAVGALGVAVYLLLFVDAAEWFFWDEFSVRFNFIAIDYLIYTNEVLGNIQQSYPLYWILGAILAVTVALVELARRSGALDLWLSSRTPARSRWGAAAAIAVPALIFGLIHPNQVSSSESNSYNHELGRNGMYAFVEAFAANDLDFDTFYPTLPPKEAAERARRLLAEPDATFVSEDPLDLTRRISRPGPEKRANVIMITVESLSARYLGIFGGKGNLTPRLDALADETLCFTDCRAVGTRTVRGMEALTLSLPPTPGRSIVKRADNENLFSIGTLAAARGYDSAFLYGGHGYFDNMNYFFSHNGFRIFDQGDAGEGDITFENAWGACDEDLFRWSLREADRSVAEGKPFFQFIMTTSNHRPYTFPEGTVDFPQHSRSGAVAYTDYAIGKFIDAMQDKPWLNNTIVVIVADHCASSAGRYELPVDRYHIPLFIYAPGLVKPQRIDRQASQLDVAPTIAGLLNWSYDSLFFGHDLMQPPAAPPAITFGTYQKLAMMTGDNVCVLKPVRQQHCFTWDKETQSLSPAAFDQQLADDAVALYQMSEHTIHLEQQRAKSSVTQVANTPPRY